MNNILKKNVVSASALNAAAAAKSKRKGQWWLWLFMNTHKLSIYFYLFLGFRSHLVWSFFCFHCVSQLPHRSSFHATPQRPRRLHTRGSSRWRRGMRWSYYNYNEREPYSPMMDTFLGPAVAISQCVYFCAPCSDRSIFAWRRGANAALPIDAVARFDCNTSSICSAAAPTFTSSHRVTSWVVWLACWRPTAGRRDSNGVHAVH